MRLMVVTVLLCMLLSVQLGMARRADWPVRALPTRSTNHTPTRQKPAPLPRTRVTALCTTMRSSSPLVVRVRRAHTAVELQPVICPRLARTAQRSSCGSVHTVKSVHVVRAQAPVERIRRLARD
jgi:hypothetical protein